MMRFLVMITCCLFWAFPVLAQQTRPSYPAGVKEQNVQDCMRQQMKTEWLVALQRKVTPQQRYAYCLCMFNYMQSTVNYNDYDRINSLLYQGRQGLTTVNQQYPWFGGHFQKGVYACAPRFLYQQQ
jgi:hypothetical protein